MGGIALECLDECSIGIKGIMMLQAVLANVDIHPTYGTQLKQVPLNEFGVWATHHSRCLESCVEDSTVCGH